jgi:hypothetical protein
VPPRSDRKRTYLTVLVTSVVVFTFVVIAPTAEMQDLRRLVGLGGERLDAAPVVPDGPGSYKFMQTQPRSDEPVGYDPCRVIEVEVNPEGAPEGYDELVDTAIAHTSAATGLRFEQIGLTDRRPPKLTTARRQPVLVAWATSDEVPDLAGDVAGIGGSTAVERDAARDVAQASVGTLTGSSPAEAGHVALELVDLGPGRPRDEDRLAPATEGHEGASPLRTAIRTAVVHETQTGDPGDLGDRGLHEGHRVAGTVRGAVGVDLVVDLLARIPRDRIVGLPALVLQEGVHPALRDVGRRPERVVTDPDQPAERAVLAPGCEQDDADEDQGAEQQHQA